jgi:hypothetical protein
VTTGDLISELGVEVADVNGKSDLAKIGRETGNC